MYKYQNDVQRLPVMPLKHILDNYLLSVQPLMSNQEMTKTRQVVEEFGKAGGIGEMLHKKLVERSQTHESWLADWWNHYAYLAFRDPVTVNVTPGIAYPHIPCGSRDEYIQTAAKLVSITGRFLMLVLTESVPPETYQGKPFCMSQYVRAGCRIPGKSVDTFRQNSITDKRHMIFFRKGNLYTLDVFYETSDGVIDLVPAAHIAKQIKWILEDGNDPNPHPVSVMTTGQRDDWYEARERLREDPINRESCDIIENSVYCICLDEPHPKLSVVNKEYSEEQAAVVALRSLHGNGLRYNLVNRWFDATSHIFIGEDGGCGTILEHSAMDGVVGIATNQFAMDFVKSGYDVFAEVSDVDPSLLKPARPLKWNLSTDTLKDIEKAKNNVDKLTQNVDFHTIKFNNFGKKLLKNFKVSPDGFMQSAIQWTYYKMYGRMGAIYESGSIRWFKYGRTDTIRSCTNASHAFAVAMQNTKKSVNI
jgi:carnitine O-acetyltransferase